MDNRSPPKNKYIQQSTLSEACLTPNSPKKLKCANHDRDIVLLPILTHEHSQQDNRQNYRQNQQQHASLAPRILLIPRCTPQLHIRTPRIAPRVVHIRRNRIELLALLAHDMRDIPEQFVQLADALLDVTDLGLALDDQGVLEVDLVLRGEAELLLSLQLDGGAAADLDRGGGLFEGGAGGGGAGALLREGELLDDLEFLERGLEFAGEFLLGVFL